MYGSRVRVELFTATGKLVHGSCLCSSDRPQRNVSSFRRTTGTMLLYFFLLSPLGDTFLLGDGLPSSSSGTMVASRTTRKQQDRNDNNTYLFLKLTGRFTPKSYGNMFVSRAASHFCVGVVAPARRCARCAFSRSQILISTPAIQPPTDAEQRGKERQRHTNLRYKEKKVKPPVVGGWRAASYLTCFWFHLTQHSAFLIIYLFRVFIFNPPNPP